MKKGFIWKLSAATIILSAVFFSGCSMEDYEITEEGHVWKYQGLVNDSTALVMVTFEQWGEEHDHHLMGWDDDFHWIKETLYYPVGINRYWLGQGRETAIATLSQVSETNDYGLRSERLDNYSSACGIILLDKKGEELDTLEIEKCQSDSAVFIGNYVNVDNAFYLVQDGRFPKQKPAYKFEHAGRNIKFTDADGDYIIYGGKP